MVPTTATHGTISTLEGAGGPAPMGMARPAEG